MSPTKKQKRGGDEKAANKKVEGPSNDNNAQNCTGFVARMYVKKDDGTLVLDNRHSCNLCKSRKVTTMCSGCGRFLCFDHDRRAKIAALLESDHDGKRLREEFPALSNLPLHMFLLTTLQQGKWMARNMVTDMIERPVSWD